MRVIVAAQILFITPPKAGCSKKKQPSYQKEESVTSMGDGDYNAQRNRTNFRRLLTSMCFQRLRPAHDPGRRILCPRNHPERKRATPCESKGPSSSSHSAYACQSPDWAIPRSSSL